MSRWFHFASLLAAYLFLCLAVTSDGASGQTISPAGPVLPSWLLQDAGKLFGVKVAVTLPDGFPSEDLRLRAFALSRIEVIPLE
jgi:hypothetical protein